MGYFVYVGSRDRSRGMQAVQKLKSLGFADVDLFLV
jgi:hypothetical protein